MERCISCVAKKKKKKEKKKEFKSIDFEINTYYFKMSETEKNLVSTRHLN